MENDDAQAAARPTRDLSRVVRSADQRPRRHHPAQRAPVRAHRRRGAGEPGEEAAVHAPTSASTIIREVFREYPNIEVDTFDGLLVEYARRRRASAIVRGIRAVSDFEYEFQMALMNRHLEPTLETVFMMPAEQYTYLSSRLIKEVFSLGGDVRGPGAAGGRSSGCAGSKQGQSRVRGSGGYDVCTAAGDRCPASATLKVAAEAERLAARGSQRRGLQRRRAGLSDARARQGRRRRRRSTPTSPATRSSPGIPELREAICAQLQARLRRRHHAGGSADHRRRQAGALQHGAGAVRSRRRGDHARAVLADDSRAGQAGRARRRSSCRRSRTMASRCTPDAIIAAITPKTKAIILNSPCNPTGALIDEATPSRRSPTPPRSAGIWIDRRSLLRAADLRDGAAQPAEGAVRSASRSDGDLPARRRRRTR